MLNIALGVYILASIGIIALLFMTEKHLSKELEALKTAYQTLEGAYFAAREENKKQLKAYEEAVREREAAKTSALEQIGNYRGDKNESDCHNANALLADFNY